MLVMADATNNDKMLGARDRLTSAASELFSAQGYDRTSVDEIVRAAGLTKGSFYHYFASKEECLRGLHRSFIESELARLEQAVEGSVDPADAITRMLRAFLRGVEEHHALFRIFDQEWRAIESDGSAAIRSKRDRIAEIVTEQIQAGINGGYFPSAGDAAVVALGLIGMCGWAHRWYDPGGSLSSEQIADVWALSLLAGWESPLLCRERIAVRSPGRP